MRSRLTAVTLAAGLGGLYYYARLRRPILTWGSTAAEASSRLPGDELLEDADDVTTRSIGIDAPAAAVLAAGLAPAMVVAMVAMKLGVGM